MQQTDLSYLIITSSIWIIIGVLFISKYSLKRIGSLYLIMYLIMYIFSIDTYIRFPHRYEGLNFFALILYIFFISIYTIPLAKINFNKTKLRHPTALKVNIVAIFIIITSLLGLVEIIQNFSIGIVGLLSDDDYGAQMYHELRNSSNFESKSGLAISNLISVFSNITKGIAPLFFLYYLSRPKINVIIVVGLLLSSFITILNGISTGSRFAIISSLMNIIAFLYVMNNFYIKTIKRIINTIVLSIAILAFIGTAAITTSRATREKFNPLESIERYACQANLVFGEYALDAGGCRNGDRTFPLIKMIFTSEVARTYTDRLQKYSYMKVNESQFISFVGDFILDFGPILGSAILLLLWLFIYVKLKPRKIISFNYLIILYLTIEILNGFYLYPFVDIGGNLHLLSLLLLYFYFKNVKFHKSIPNSNSPVNI